jgi:hypothetical protein
VIYRATQPMQAPDKVINVDDKFYLVQVATINQEKPADYEKQLIEYRPVAGQQLASLTLRALVNKLKADTPIDFSPTLLGEE